MAELWRRWPFRAARSSFAARLISIELVNEFSVLSLCPCGLDPANCRQHRGTETQSQHRDSDAESFSFKRGNNKSQSSSKISPALSSSRILLPIRGIQESWVSKVSLEFYRKPT